MFTSIEKRTREAGKIKLNNGIDFSWRSRKLAKLAKLTWHMWVFFSHLQEWHTKKYAFVRITQKSGVYTQRLLPSDFHTPHHANRVYESKARNTLHPVTCTASILPPPQALRFRSRWSGQARSTRNWGRAREGSREGERKEAHPFPFPSSLGRPTLSQRERRLGTRQASICACNHPAS